MYLIEILFALKWWDNDGLEGTASTSLQELPMPMGLQLQAGVELAGAIR